MSFSWSVYSQCERSKIEEFIKVNEGSFFHEPSFYDYHDKKKFVFLNFICRTNRKIVAWLPGYKKGKKYVSPAGASYGGPFFSTSIGLEQNLEIINSLRDYLLKKDFDEVSFTTAPSIYFGDYSFSLSALGFKLSDRIGCHALQLAGKEWPSSMNKSKRYLYRKAMNSNLILSELGSEYYTMFHKMLTDHCRQLKTNPTHNKNELLMLKKILPNRVRLFAAMEKNEIKAAVLILVISPRVAYSFYIVSGISGNNSGATLVAIMHAIDVLKGEGFHWLDLGPSTFKNFSVNKGVSRFKQLLGSKLYTRDSWTCKL
tara:strand:+ start:18152 stop:19093 length:942 start_codon:yes stop_codon:yes gene_type:complete